MTREEIIAAYPIEAELAKRGIQLKRKGNELTCLCPFHTESTPSFTVTPSKSLFYCFGCGVNGSVIDLVMKLDRLSSAKAMAKLTGENPPQPPEPKTAITFGGKEEKIYKYLDETGELLYEVVRYNPKGFRQRHYVNGNVVWSMDGVRRVPYNLPTVLNTNKVWIVEGEKDADKLGDHGIVATCNVGGAGKWMEGYSDFLKGKDVILCGDNDEPGKKHIAGVLDSLAGKVKSARVVTIPSPYKDVSDFLSTNTVEHFHALLDLADKAPRIDGGINIPVRSMGELEHSYREFLKVAETTSLNLGGWLPSLGKNVRSLVPGELVTVMADTGVGKTAILQNIAIHARPLKVLLFELELPGTLCFERFLQIDSQRPGNRIQSTYANGGQEDWETHGRINHIYTCSLSKLSVEDIEKLIIKSELKIGERPAVVMIDYIGLVAGKGGSRYERMSNVAEEMKVLAKSTNTIIILSSQIHRKAEDAGKAVSLHDAKDSGSIENSSGLVLGCWKESHAQLNIKVLKNTKGKAGFTIPCRFDGESLSITEMIVPDKTPKWLRDSDREEAA